MLNRVSFALQQQVFCIKVACEHALQWGKSAKINQRAKRAERRLGNRKGLSLWRKFPCRVPFQGTRCALDPSAISYRSDRWCWHVWLTNPFGQRICISCPKVMNITSPCERFFFYTDELFEKELSDSLQVKKEQKHCLRTVQNRKAVLGILHTGFGQSLIFQNLLCVIKTSENEIPDTPFGS